MKITIVLGPFLYLPPGPGGAMERLWDGLAKLFVRRGHQVTMLSKSYGDTSGHSAVDGVEHIRCRGFKQTKSIQMNLAKDFVYSIRIMRALPRSDIVVTNVFWLPFLLGLLGKRWGKVVVNANRYPKGQIRLYLRTARIHVPSKAIHEAVCVQCPAAESMTKVIPNPVDIEVFGSQRRQKNKGEPKSIVYTGRVHPEKGIHLLIEAFGILRERCSNLSLRIIGPTEIERGGGGEKYMDRLRQLAGDRPVEFVEPIGDPRKLSAALHAADYFCYPSLAAKGEACPVAPLEAMATGLAPVVSDLAQFSDYLTDGETGLIFDHREPNAVMNLTDALQKLIADPRRTDQMGRCASQKARQFSYDSVADLYLQDFQSLLEPREAR